MEAECCNNKANFLVTSLEGTPLKYAQIELLLNGTVKYSPSINNDGYAVIKNICKGTYNVKVYHAGIGNAEFPMIFNCKDSIYKHVSLGFTENCCDNKIKFIVKGEGGLPFKGAKVTLHKGSVKKYEGVASDNGEVNISGICKGEYAALINFDDYVSQEFIVNFDCSQSLIFEKSLEKVKICCTGWAHVIVFDEETQQKLYGATVKIFKSGNLHNTLIVENGFVKFTELCDGNYGFRISKSGYYDLEWNAVILCNLEPYFVKYLIKK